MESSQEEEQQSQIIYQETILQGESFNVNQKYQLIQVVGRGSYGIVAFAQDKLDGDRPVAIQKIRNVFENRIYWIRTLRELKILRLVQHKNIINLISIQLPPSKEQFQEIYLVFQYMEQDLGRVVTHAYKQLKEDHYKNILYDILKALQFMKKQKILHRDLKPRNILINPEEITIKICDFGLSRYLNNAQNSINSVTDYVVTRWYRPPELLLSFRNYNDKIDMWSLGMIFAQLLLGKAFLKGSSTKEQLLLIFSRIGNATEIDRSLIHLNQKRNFINNIVPSDIPDIRIHFKETDPSEEALDLLRKMLQINPNERISVDQALDHPYFEDLQQDDDDIEEQETKSEPETNRLQFEFEQIDIHNFDEATMRKIIYQEILLYHSPEFKQIYFDKLSQDISVYRHNLPLQELATSLIINEDQQEDEDWTTL